MKYIYNPCVMDHSDPIIIAGVEIKTGAEVQVTKSKIDPLGWFRFIEDDDGNKMSVYKNSIQLV